MGTRRRGARRRRGRSDRPRSASRRADSECGRRPGCPSAARSYSARPQAWGRRRARSPLPSGRRLRSPVPGTPPFETRSTFRDDRQEYVGRRCPPAWSVTVPSNRSAGRSAGSSCLNGPTPVIVNQPTCLHLVASTGSPCPGSSARSCTRPESRCRSARSRRRARRSRPASSGSLSSWVMEGPVRRSRAPWSSLRCDARSHPCAIGVCGIERALEGDLVSRPDRTRAGSGTGRRPRSSRRRRASRRAGPVISISSSSTVAERDALADRLVRRAPRVSDRRHARASSVGVEVAASSTACRGIGQSASSRQLEASPSACRTFRSARGCLVPAVVLSLQEVVEEAELDLAAVVGVVVRPVLEAVHLEPLLLRGRRGRSRPCCRAGAARGRPSCRPRAAAP